MFLDCEQHVKDFIELKKAYEWELQQKENAETWNNLGVLYHVWADDFSEAQKCYEKALNIDCNHKNAKNNLNKLIQSPRNKLSFSS